MELDCGFGEEIKAHAQALNGEDEEAEKQSPSRGTVEEDMTGE